nr:uncharacterized protein KIAA0754 homolog [Loxodonta africana]
MGKPLSRPDCLRQNPTCLGKGEEEDGYIEDCYVPQRSIYDTMRINEQIDQGSKLNQTSKSTMEKMEGSTISSNGTLGAASNVFESRAPESKKLDERIIFDALKLSSDVQKSAPVPPRRRPNAERKDNVNRRSWKSFMPPNFPEFAERMEASLSEVSEAGASNPSLQEKRESSSVLTESSGHLDHREPQAESVTLEHVPKSIGIPEVPDVKNLSGDCQNFRLQQHSESSPREFQPLESETAAASSNTDVMQEHRFSSATWPRAMKSLAKEGFSEKQHPLGDTACTMEMPPLSPCLSEELLDPELHILVTPSLREKTESELKFEEDERWIMMEAEEEWEEEKLSDRGKTFLITDEKKNSLADIFEEREQTNSVAVVEDKANCSAAVLTFDHPRQICSDDPQPAKDHLASVPKDSPFDYSCVLSGEGAVRETENRAAQGLERLVSDSECIVGPVDAEQLSDTDSVQMFLELEKECLCEEEVMPVVELENQASSEGLAPFQDAEDSHVMSYFPGAALEKEQHVGFLNVKVKDCDTGLDCEYFNALDFSQVPNTIELITHPDTMRNASTISKEECEKVPFSPKTVEEFKFRCSADLESLGELDLERLSNSDHRPYFEENLSSSVTSELASENGNLSQVDCSHIEGNVEECVERVSLSSALDYELTDVTSEPEVEVLSYGSHLLTDEMHLEGEQGAINQGSNSLTSSGHMDPCKLLSVEKLCDEDGEAKELDYKTKLLKDQAPTHFLRDFPEQVSPSLQRKSSESEILSLHPLVGALRHSRDGMETVNDIKLQPNVASSEGVVIREEDGPAAVVVIREEDVPAAAVVTTEEDGPGATVVTTEEDGPGAAVVTIEEDGSGAAVVTTEEDGPGAAVVTTEEDGSGAAVVTTEEDGPGAAVVTIEEDGSGAAVVTIEGDGPGAAVVTIEGDGSGAAVVTIEEDGPAAAVVTIEEDGSGAAVVTVEEDGPAAAVVTIEEDDSAAAVVTVEEGGSTAAVVTIEEDGPAAAVVTIEEDGTAAAVVTREEDGPAAAVSAPEGAPASAVAVPTVEGMVPVAAATSPKGTSPAAAVAVTEDVSAVADPSAEGSAATATVPTKEEDDAPERPVTPAAAVPTPKRPAAPAVGMPVPEEDDTPATALPASEDTPEGPAAPDVGVPTPEGHAAPDVGMLTPEGPFATAAEVLAPEEDDTPDKPAAPAAAVAAPEEDDTPDDPDTPAAAVAAPEEDDTLDDPAAPAAAVAAPEEDDTPDDPDTPAAAVAAPEEDDTPDDPDTPAAAVAAPEEDDTSEGPAAPDVALPTAEGPAAPDVAVPTAEEPPAPAAAAPAVEEVFPAGVSSVGDTAHTDSVPVSEGRIPVQVEASPAGMWIKKDLDSPAFGVKEMTGTVLHGTVRRTSCQDGDVLYLCYPEQ